jgi:hypothetical protein
VVGAVRHGSSIEAAFLAVLDQIASTNRDLTPWECGCLYAALCAIAVGDHATAEQRISLSKLRDAKVAPPVQVVPPLTVEDLRDALSSLKASVFSN